MLSSIYWLPEAASTLLTLSSSCRGSSCLRAALNEIAELFQDALRGESDGRRRPRANYVVVQESNAAPLPFPLQRSSLFAVQSLTSLQQARGVDVVDLDLIPHEVLVEMDRNRWTLARAWREHLGMRPSEAASNAGLSTERYLGIEARSARHSRFARLLATALDLQPSQLRQAPQYLTEFDHAFMGCEKVRCRARRSARRVPPE